MLQVVMLGTGSGGRRTSFWGIGKFGFLRGLLIGVSIASQWYHSSEVVSWLGSGGAVGIMARQWWSSGYFTLTVSI